jgi:anthranilate phosphoribosyltransferase
MGRGPSRARSLTRDEARDAMCQILAGNAAPEAIGALFMLMRYRGETADEVAGFAEAARDGLAEWNGIGAALDWPSYAAGRSRGLPWFLLSALLLARAGRPVLLHGWNSHQNPVADVRTALRQLSIPITGRPDCAGTALARGGIAYVPLEALSPALLKLLKLRDVLGLRSAVNTVCRMLNPGRAATMVQGVFHPSYRELQQDAGQLLGQQNLIVIKGGGGEFERHPGKTCDVFGLKGGVQFSDKIAPMASVHRRLADETALPAHLLDVWTGQRADPWAEQVVIGTAALALSATEPGLGRTAAMRQAEALWHARGAQLAA